MKNSQKIIEGYRLSPQQKRLWHFRQNGAQTPLARCVIEITGALDEKVLQQAIQQLVSHHEILRTSFQLLPGMTIPVQVIAEDANVVLRSLDCDELNLEQEKKAIDEFFDVKDDHVSFSSFRAGLCRLSSTKHLLLLSASALCLDEPSIFILFRQVADAYAAMQSGETAFTFDSMQYADVSEWQNELLDSTEAHAALQYWNHADLYFGQKQHLPFELRPSAVVVTETAIALSATVVQKLERIAQDYEVALPTFLLGCWQTVLLKSTNWEELNVAVRFDGRNFPELENAVGPIERYIPIPSQVNDDLTFGAVLRELQEKERSTTKLQQFFDAQRLSASETQPVFSFLFSWHDQPAAIEVAQTKFVLLEQTADVEPCKLRLTAQKLVDGNLSLQLHYNASIFSAEDVQRLVERLETLIEKVDKTPQPTMTAIDMVGRKERLKLLGEFSRNDEIFSEGECIHELFESQAKRTPDAFALVFENEKLKFSELNARANQLAHRLEQIGVGPDDAVGICLDRSLNLIVALLGIMKAGAAYVPLDAGFPLERLKDMLADAGARVLVTRAGFVDELALYAKQTVYVDDPKFADDPQSSVNLATRVTDQNLAYIIFTSGSTGRPKGVAVEHRQLVNYVRAVTQRMRFMEEMAFASVSTIAADLGNTVLYPPLLTGGTLHLISEERATSPDQFADYCHRNEIDVLKIVPSHLSALLSAANAEAVLPRKVLVLGGEACSCALADRVAQLKPGCALFNHYGPTEATVGATTFEVKSEGGQLPGDIVPLGRPLANSQIFVLDKSLRPTPIGVAGELHIGGAGVARAYVGRAEATGEKFVPNPFAPSDGERLYCTGDLARFRIDGNVEFLGRIDDQVKIHGFRIEPEEVASVLRTHDSVKEAVVIAREDQPGEKRLVAYLVARDSPVDISQLKSFLQTKLPDYMIPKAIVLVETIPLTRNGKIDRNALPAPESVRSADGPVIGPRNPIETILAGIWAEVLGVKQLSIHDNFFELGGDSILSIQIIARANQSGLQLSPRQVFLHQTIAELAAVSGTIETVTVEQGPVTGAVPLTPVQKRFFDQNLSEPHYYNQATLLDLEEPLDANVLQQVFERLIEQHDALRLRFTKTDSGWQQELAGIEAGNSEATNIQQFDLANLPEQAARMQASLNLESGPIMRVGLFKSNDGKVNKLLIVIHHLAVDGVSWRILLEDLHALYLQFSSGRKAELAPKTTSFKSWSEQLQKHVESGALAAEAPFWLRRFEPAHLPVDYESSENTAGSAATVTVALDPRETLALLMEAPAAYRTQINEVLITALAQTLAVWTRSNAILFDLEGHGREELFPRVDLTRTVGWFTTIFPVAIDLNGSTSVMQSLRLVKEQLRGIPNRGIGYGLLRYLSENSDICEALKAQPKAELRFNYLGQTDRAVPYGLLFNPATESSGPAQSPSTPRGYLLNIIASVTGGQLRLEWTYCENIHRRQTIERVAEIYVNELRTMITNARAGDATTLSPSDFPSAKLSREDLSKVLAKLRR